MFKYNTLIIKMSFKKNEVCQKLQEQQLQTDKLHEELKEKFKEYEEKSKIFEEKLKIIKEHREHNSISYLCYILSYLSRITRQKNNAEVKVSQQDSNIKLYILKLT